MKKDKSKLKRTESTEDFKMRIANMIPRDWEKEKKNNPLVRTPKDKGYYPPKRKR